MKKLFFLFLLIIIATPFILSLASAGDCTPPAGYSSCYEQTRNQGDCHAHAKVYTDLSRTSTTINGTKYIKLHSFTVKVGFTGDDLYRYDGLSSWDDVDCDESGCSGLPAEAKTYDLSPNVGTVNTCVGMVAYDYDEEEGCWAYAWAGLGWVGDCAEARVVECVKDSWCTDGKVCDMSSADWRQWTCKTKGSPSVCTNGDKKNTSCECGKSYTSANCVNGQWVPIQFAVNPCLSLCPQGCTSIQPSNTCGIDNCNITYDKCNANYTCSNNECVEGKTQSTDTLAKIKEIATTPLFKLGTFQVVLWHLAILLFVLFFIIRR